MRQHSVAITMIFAALLFVGTSDCPGARPHIESLSTDPYLGYIVIDADSGKVLIEENADARAYPASMVKLMTMMVVLDEVAAGDLNLDDRVTVTRYAESMGGTEVWLKVGEVFSVDELLYAMMIKSANDAAAALAVHVAGSRHAFASLMNKRAKELGMNSTVFDSPHGLPPTVQGEKPDVSTPRDMAILSSELLRRHKDVLRYTSTLVRNFREQGPVVEMRSHNNLLRMVKGCDGLKTGYFTKAGFSVSATVEREGKRVIAVIMCCRSSKSRDMKARELMEQGLLMAPRKREKPVEPRKPVAQVSGGIGWGSIKEFLSSKVSAGEKQKKARGRVDWGKVKRFFKVSGMAGAVVLILVLSRYLVVRKRDRWKYRL